MSEGELTRPPGIRVPSDNFAVEIGGVTYHPHAGEWIEFDIQPSIADFVGALGLLRMDEQIARAQAGHIDPQLEQTLAGLVPAALDRIIAWSWTDKRGVAYANPPTEADIRRLSQAEWQYVISRGAIDSEDERKNASGSSTTASTANRGQRRHPNG